MGVSFSKLAKLDKARARHLPSGIIAIATSSKKESSDSFQDCLSSEAPHQENHEQHSELNNNDKETGSSVYAYNS